MKRTNTYTRLSLLILLPIALSASYLRAGVTGGGKAAAGCTTIILGRKATADGSVIMRP